MADQVASLFWAKVDVGADDVCWEWVAAKSAKGYGIFNTGWRYLGTDRAHRISWILSHGTLAKELNVCHRCDNPGCVNPKHLFIGSQQDNIDDKVAKSRQAKLGTHGRTVLAEHEAKLIRGSSETCTALAKQYGVSITCISRIKRGKSWKSLEKIDV